MANYKLKQVSPLGVTCLVPSLHYVEAPHGWVNTFAHNVRVAAVFAAAKFAS